MEIRSITVLTDIRHDLTALVRFFAATRDHFHVPLQTRRVAFDPHPHWIGQSGTTPEQLAAFAARWREAGADYLSLGPVQLQHDGRWLEQLPDLLGVSGMLFASAEVADTNGNISLERCFDVARVVKAASRLESNGFGNLYFTALANCPPGSPFFPVAYHKAGAPPGFALALEAADLAVSAFRQAASLQEARQNLQEAIEREAQQLEAAAIDLARAHGIAFAGIDFSLAPYPEQARSLAAALEALGPAHVGAPGSLFAAAFITEAIDRAQFNRCGFSGLMLPVLEDAVLAQRAAEGLLSVSDLLNFASVCGVGLDTVPLAGDVSEEALAGILMDMAALATRLRKPLTARLMPLPGLSAGDAVQFDFPYFADSRVMPVAGPGVRGLLAGADAIAMHSLGLRRGQDGA